MRIDYRGRVQCAMCHFLGETTFPIFSEKQKQSVDLGNFMKRNLFFGVNHIFQSVYRLKTATH